MPEQQLAGAFDTIGFAVFTTDPTGRITALNPAAESLTGKTAGDILGLHYAELFETAPSAEDPLCPDNGIMEWVYRQTDCDPLALLVSVTRQHAQAGGGGGYLINAADFSRQKKLEGELQHHNRMLERAQRIASVGSWTLDLVSGELRWSDEIFRLFEIDPHEFGASYEAFLAAIHPDDRAMVNDAYSSSLETRKSYSIDHRLLFNDGRVKWVRESCETEYSPDGDPLISRGTVQDITEQYKAEQTIRLYASVYRDNPEAILITDRNNRIIAANPALQKLTGYSEAELLGQNPRVLASGHTPPETWEMLWSSLHRRDRWQGELIDRRKDGHVYPKWASISVIRDAKGEITHHIAAFMDITERKEAEERIHHLMHHDLLTDLVNRGSAEDHLRRLLKTQKDRTGAVLLVNIDHFTRVNDSLGNRAGDALLAEAAKRICKCVGEGTVVGRLGSDEFVVLLDNLSDPMQATDSATRILRTLKTPYTLKAQQVSSSCSIGISVFPDNGQSAGELLKHADTAMRFAKQMGRNNCQFFTNELNRAAQERVRLEAGLMNAIDRQEFELHYQPKIDTHSGRIAGVEGLIRWRHPDLGLVSPDKFIPLAEETGMIDRIGAWVTDEACAQLASWRKKGLHTTVAINLSARQLHNESILFLIRGTMERFGIPGGALDIEITETAAMADAETARIQMQKLREAGVSISIDDFGTGYSSLSYLKLFPIQTLKLDRAFVQNIETDEDDAAIATASISLAHGLGLKVVAEGVETQAQRSFLVNRNCDYLQGYLFSPPVPAAEMEKLLEQQAPFSDRS